MKKTLFHKILESLYENIIPSIISDINELGVPFNNVILDVRLSLCFFKHLNMDFPFDYNELQTVKDASGNDIRIVVFSIRNNGQICISNNCTVEPNGTIQLGNQTIIIFNDYSEMFNKVQLDNATIFFLSKELVNNANVLKSDVKLIKELLDAMTKIQPKITRQVLLEKK